MPGGTGTPTTYSVIYNSEVSKNLGIPDVKIGDKNFMTVLKSWFLIWTDHELVWGFLSNGESVVYIIPLLHGTEIIFIIYDMWPVIKAIWKTEAANHLPLEIPNYIMQLP